MNERPKSLGLLGRNRVCGSRLVRAVTGENCPEFRRPLSQRRECARVLRWCDQSCVWSSRALSSSSLFCSLYIKGRRTVYNRERAHFSSLSLSLSYFLSFVSAFCLLIAHHNTCSKSVAEFAASFCQSKGTIMQALLLAGADQLFLPCSVQEIYVHFKMMV